MTSPLAWGASKELITKEQRWLVLAQHGNPMGLARGMGAAAPVRSAGSAVRSATPSGTA